MRQDREGRKMMMEESSNLDMQSQFVVELDLAWVMEEMGRRGGRLNLKGVACLMS